MSNNLLNGWIQISLTLTFGLILVLAARRPIRAYFSPLHAYMIWLIVPLMTLICAIGYFWPQPEFALPIQAMPHVPKNLVHQAAAQARFDWPWYVLLVWIAGTVIQFGLHYWRQLNFLRLLGELKPHQDIFIASSIRTGPALVGIFSPKIVVPNDFFMRYSNEEQRLILAHEIQHKLRGDNWYNALCALIQSVFWFHPLVHFCAKRFRIDQEMACDFSVISLHNKSRKIYATAMLKTQTFDVALPLGCSWQSHTLLKERMMNLSQKAPNSLQRNIGYGLIAVFICLSASLTWAAQTESNGTSETTSYDVTISVSVNKGEPKISKLHVKDNEPFLLTGGETELWGGSATVKTNNRDTLKIAMNLERNAKIIGHPTLITGNAQTAIIETNDGDSFIHIEFNAQPSKI